MVDTVLMENESLIVNYAASKAQGCKFAADEIAQDARLRIFKYYDRIKNEAGGVDEAMIKRQIKFAALEYYRQTGNHKKQCASYEGIEESGVQLGEATPAEKLSNDLQTKQYTHDCISYLFKVCKEREKIVIQSLLEDADQPLSAISRLHNINAPDVRRRISKRARAFDAKYDNYFKETYAN